ncbi:MAG: hypothetical protein KatS3mg068_2472 [Candidatus Sericytochromatia bacterium]|nr:MAG: hypothetical protein KatS3mg068_1593 [Candidatus Sericytochromatia bacterium]GIW23465.1 MAG: hypothetical protein KatS3mg068_2472 [Candidatus Sericytochromatia bacterium]
MSKKKYTANFLLPYQANTLKQIEKHRFCIIMWSRQTGKSFLVSLFALLRAIEKPNHLVAIISPTERQSKEFMEKVKKHVEFFKIIGLQYGETFFSDANVNILEIKLPNGSRIIGLPANPDGVRGLSGDVIMEEAAFFKDGLKLYQAIFPSITRNDNYKLIVISTPKSKNDLFYHLWLMSETNENWYREKLTIYDAVDNGLNIDIQQLKKAVPSDDIFNQEYLCQFLDDSFTLLPYEIIEQCTLENIYIDNLNQIENDIYLGIDIGRRKDLTVISVLEKINNILYLRKLEEIQNLSFSEQFKIIDHYCYFAKKVCIDETGIGMQLAEELIKKWGYKVEAVYFTSKSKEELATKLQSKFFDKTIFIPPKKELIEDLHSVSKSFTQSGNIKIEGNYQESHADRFWSLALAVKASLQTKEKLFIEPIFINQSLSEIKYGMAKIL